MESVLPVPRSARSFIVLALCALTLAGCATPTDFSSVPAYNRYSIDDIVAMVDRGESSALIIRKLQESNGFYPLKASELVKLHERGVPLDVLDYLQGTYVRGVRREERFQLPQRFSAPY